jgi:hypothetical protein
VVKLCFQMIVFNGDHVLGEALRSVLPFGPLVVTEGPCGHWARSEYKTSTDRTNDILDAHKSYGAGILGVVHGQFPEKDAMVNASAHLVPEDTTHLFVVDSDEVWRTADIKRIIKVLDESNADSMSVIADSFFGGFDHILTGFERDYKVTRIQRWYPSARWATHRPPTVLDPLGRPYASLNHIDAMEMLAMGVTMPHYSYVFPSQAFMKHQYYSNYAQGLTIPDYPTEIFVPWVKGSPDERHAIERRWRGVHNFIPRYRGDCFTEAFTGQHPQEIESNLSDLRRRIEQELEVYT